MFSTILRTKRSLPYMAGLLGLVLVAASAVPPSLQAQKRRIAVMKFDATPDAKQKAALQFGMQNDLGATFADLIVNKLTQDGKFDLFERSQLEKIIKEQNTSNSDRADPNTAIKLGKIAGVDGIIIGSVTQFTGDTATSSTNPVTVFGHVIPGSSTTTVTVTVGITARLIDTTTGAILASATGLGTAQGKQDKRDGPLGGTHAGETKTKLSNDATTQAIAQITTQIEAAPEPTVSSGSRSVPPPVVETPKVPYKGIVADVSGTTLVLTVGTNSGLKVGDIVQILRVNHVVKDPTTGAIIRTINDKVGEAKITEADATSSVATYMGTATVTVKDIVSSQP